MNLYDWLNSTLRVNIRRKSNEYECERKVPTKKTTMKSFPLSNNGFCMSTFCVYFYCLFTTKIYIICYFFVLVLSFLSINNIIKIEKYQQHLFKFSSRMNGINVATHLSRYIIFCTVGPRLLSIILFFGIIIYKAWLLSTIFVVILFTCECAKLWK